MRSFWGDSRNRRYFQIALQVFAQMIRTMCSSSGRWSADRTSNHETRREWNGMGQDGKYGRNIKRVLLLIFLIHTH